MKKIVLLFSHTLTEAQEEELKKDWLCNKIIYIPSNLKNKWANINEESNLDEFKNFLKAKLNKDDYVLIQGEWGATYQMINFSKENSYIPIYSSTARSVEEYKEGDSIIKKSIFLHRGFKKY
nr:CRISPR-associated protein Csx20 [Fusobacterium gastrosuis]